MAGLRRKVGQVSEKVFGKKLTSHLKNALIGRSNGPSGGSYGDNTVVNHPRLNNASIVFKGNGNILYCESPDIIFQNCKLTFEGDNSVIYVSKHSNKNRKYRTQIYIHHDSAIYIGENVNFHPGGEAYIVASENKNIVIGDDCLFSLGALFRTSDGHAAYDSATGERLNLAKSIFIGDHVWFGQNVTALKGSKVGSGSIIGAGSVLTGKTMPSNTSCAGAPARVLRSGVFFTKPNVNKFTSRRLESVAHHDTDTWIYQDDGTVLSFDDIDAGLSAAKTSDEKLDYIKKHLASDHNKNRFYVSS